jgi:hypothetical protein
MLIHDSLIPLLLHQIKDTQDAGPDFATSVWREMMGSIRPILKDEPEYAATTAW